MKCTIATFLLVIVSLPWHINCVDSSCPDPGVDVAPTLDPAGVKTFSGSSLKKYAKLIKKKYKVIGAAMKDIDTAVDKIISDSSNADDTDYPACMYDKSCPFTLSKVVNWQLTGEKCWLIEPLAWANCTYDVPMVDCADRETGYVCKETYTIQNVWVYCDTKKKPISQRQVAVATGCQAVMYDCSSRPSR